MKAMIIRSVMLGLLLVCLPIVAKETITDEDLYQGLQRFVFSDEQESTDQEENELLDLFKEHRSELKNAIATWCLQCKHAVHFGDCLAVYKQRQFANELEQKIALHVVMTKVENFFELINLKYEISDDSFDDLMRLVTVGLRTRKQQKA